VDVLYLHLYYGFFSDPIISLLDSLSDENAMKIAYFHLTFNILTACIMTPLIKYLVQFVTYLIKDKEPPKEYIEWFIKDKDEKNALMDSRPSSNSININLTNDINTEDLGLSSNQTEHNDDIIIKDEDEIRNEILRKDSSDISDKDNESNKIKNVENRNNIFEDKNEEDDKKLEEEKIDEIKNEEKNTIHDDE